MFYTVIPLEDILEGFEDEPEATTEHVVNGVLMEVQLLAGFEAKVVRVLSSNPADFLHVDKQPGSIIKLN